MTWQACAHLRWHGFIGLCWHDGIIIAAPPVPTPKMPHITFNVLNGLFLGALPSDADEGRIVGPSGIPFMGRTTDAGFITPHVSIPPNNALLPLTILLGGSESMLGSSKVRIRCTNPIWGTDEYDMAACTLPAIPLSTNFGCNDPLFVPLDFVISPNSVTVGISLTDLLVMAFDLVLMALLDGVMAVGSKGASKALGKVKAKRAAKKLAGVARKADDAYAKALKQADIDEALRGALRKRRAKMTGTPAPPPKPTRRLQRARREADEAFNRAFREAFSPTGGRLDQAMQKLERVRLRLTGRLTPVAVAAIKTVLDQAVDGAAPSPADNPAIQAGEQLLAAAGV